MRSPGRSLLTSILCVGLLACDQTRAASNPYYTWAWGRKIQAKSPYNADYEEYDDKSHDSSAYYPFTDLDIPVLPPIIRSDGTTKSRVPQDTLLREQEPHFEGGFTSLDEHLKEKNKGIMNSVDSNIGDLDPKEVYYADDDLLIIKGGGFPSPIYEEPLQELQTKEEHYYPHYLEGFSRPPPSPHNEYNGNVPTIVKPPTNYWSNPVAASHYPPFALFVPARLFASDTNSFYLYVPYIPPTSYNYIIAPPRTSYASKWTKPSSQLIVKPAKAPPKIIASLAGDTDVNYLHPRPSIDPDAEIIHSATKHYRRKTHIEMRHHKPQAYYNRQSKRPKL